MKSLELQRIPLLQVTDEGVTEGCFFVNPEWVHAETIGLRQENSQVTVPCKNKMQIPENVIGHNCRAW